MPPLPIHLLLQNTIHQPLLLQYPQALELLALNLDPVHASATTTNVFDFEFGGVQRGVEEIEDFRLVTVEMRGC